MPNTLEFDVGFFEGNSKKWLVVPEDLTRMYSKCNEYKISLWCDVSTTNESRKRKNGEPSKSRRQEKEDLVESIYLELLEQHSDSYSKPQLKLWARMIHCGTHSDYNEPPKVPLITGPPPKRQKTDTLANAFTDAARAVASVFSPPVTSSSSVTSSVGISPGKAVELRSKNLEQLRYIQQLYEDNILSSAEYAEQKRMILESIRKLN